MSSTSPKTGDLLQRLVAGDEQALADLFDQHRERLFRILETRLDSRLKGRVDADDILQEVYLDAAARLTTFTHHHSGSFLVWLRLIAMQTLTNVHRRHLQASMRDASREFSMFAPAGQSPDSTSLAVQLLGRLTSPSQVAIREELAKRLEEAVTSMEPIDREVLTLRHFEQLTNKEIAEVLGIQPKAASIRYVRALKRLKSIVPDVDQI